MTHSLQTMILKWLPKKAPTCTTLDAIWWQVKQHLNDPVISAFSDEELDAVVNSLAFDLEELYSKANKQEAKR